MTQTKESSSASASGLDHIGAVVIGRNEGIRLDACLASLGQLKSRIVYVDSGSTDDSLDIARRHGAATIELDMSIPFSAARARNAGWRQLLATYEGVQAIQFVDGDCEVVPSWIATAMHFMSGHPDVAAVCGRRKERYPEASIYNFLCDIEWNTPVGDAKAIGGDALIRSAALLDVDGYDDSVIAGEEPEMCVRLRRKGWKIHRLDAPMTMHDAAITRFGQWWTRCVRCGYAYALGAWKHGKPPELHWVREKRRALAWGFIIPIFAAITTFALPLGWVSWLIYPIQWLRLTRAAQPPKASAQALFMVVGKFAEAKGVLRFFIERLRGQERHIIEYKNT